MKKLKVGVVGVGHMGHYHVRIYSEIPSIELVGIADVNEALGRDLANKYETQYFGDYRRLFGKVDAVSIAVPTSMHYAVAKEFLENRIHVLLEKPMTIDLEEGRELIQIAAREKCILQIGHVERFNAAVQELNNIVTEPLLIEAHRLGPFNKRTKDTGVILDLMIHDIDIVLNLIDSNIKNMNVCGKSICSDYEDLVSVQMEFENGCIALLTASRLTENKIRSLAITQKDAYIFLDYAEQEIHIHRQASTKYWLTKEKFQYKQESFIERLFVHKDNPLKLQLVHFIDCITNGTTPIFSGEEDLKALEVALHILEKLKNGIKV